MELHVTVDRGDETWKGNVGVITTLFRKISINPRNTVAITCRSAGDVPFRIDGAAGQRASPKGISTCRSSAT